MAKKHLVNVTYYDILKLLWAVVLFFLALVIWVKEAWESFTMIETDYFQQDEDGVLEDWEEHWAAYKSNSEKLASVCALHNDWCDKIVRSWNFSDYDKIWYVSQYFVIFDFLDRKIKNAEAYDSKSYKPSEKQYARRAELAGYLAQVDNPVNEMRATIDANKKAIAEAEAKIKQLAS